MLIAIEGLDACGKGTQVELLAERLRKLHPDWPPIVYKFPVKDSVTGKLIYEMMAGVRRFYRDPTQDDRPVLHANALALQCVMRTNRLVYAQEIENHKRDGRTIIFDRYVDSGIVYGCADGLDRDWCKLTNAQPPQPDLHILLDIDADDSFKRRPERQNAYEASRERMGRAARLYREWWLENGAIPVGNPSWVIVDGRRDVVAVHNEIWAAVTVKLEALRD